MYLKCLFGLAVCLNYHGSYIPEDNVREMRALCNEAARLPAGSFISTSENPRGNDIARELMKQGLDFTWSEDASIYVHQLVVQRKTELLGACEDLLNIAEGRQNWSD